MSEIIPDTELVIRPACPSCDANFDPKTMDVFWCELHTPDRTGVLDGVVSSSQYLSGSGEAEGESNKKWCDFFHRNKED